MRILLAIHNAYTDGVSGAARSTRTMTEWLAEAGHEVRVLCTARFDAAPPQSITAHLRALGIRTRPASVPPSLARWLRRSGVPGEPRPATRFDSNGVPVTLIHTRHNDQRAPDRLEYAQLVAWLDHQLGRFRPEVVMSYGGHPVVREWLRHARSAGARTVFSVHNQGYEQRRYFDHAHAVHTCSPYIARLLHERIGLVSTALTPQIREAGVIAAEAQRRFVTFVNPSLHKGAGVFARVAEVLGRERPDIPMMVVQSAADGAALNSIPGIDFSRYPQIMAAPFVKQPAAFYGLTRILLVPSVCHEAFGTVAAEALLNGIPALVSDRGALPETVGDGGQVISIPGWLEPQSTRLPSVEEVQPWCDAIRALWDDAGAYERASESARREGVRLYSESAQRARLAQFIESVMQGPPQPMCAPLAAAC